MLPFTACFKSCLSLLCTIKKLRQLYLAVNMTASVKLQSDTCKTTTFVIKQCYCLKNVEEFTTHKYFISRIDYRLSCCFLRRWGSDIYCKKKSLFLVL